ncbi:MAG: hypothetical protein NTW86_02155 [Candidatus Sumerlaeota bacterium]|nr:hypothetical protein [Candidatus Sumerlaeota bacterium]
MRESKTESPIGGGARVHVLAVSLFVMLLRCGVGAAMEGPDGAAQSSDPTASVPSRADKPDQPGSADAAARLNSQRGSSEMASATRAEKSGLTLYYRSGSPQVEFAASEIQQAAKAAGIPCRVMSVEELPKARDGACIAIAATADDSRALEKGLGIAPLSNASPQSYAIRRKAEGATDAWAVLGADAAGAMYGGLDLAEAIRLGTLDKVANADGSSGASCSMRWRAIGITCSRCGISIRFRRW